MSIAALLSSCATMTKTASTADINSSLQSATVADLDVSPQRITYTMTPTKAVQRGGDENVKRVAESEALERNGGGDLLVNPEFVISKRRGLFSSKITSVTVSGRPATYTNIRSFNDSVWCNPVFRGIVASRHFADINPLMPEAVTPKEKKHVNEYPFKKTTWMVRLGVGSNKFVGDENMEGESRPGWSLGLEFNRQIGKKGGYWGMDFTFASRGYKGAQPTENMGYTNGYYSWGYGGNSYRIIEEELKAQMFSWSPFFFGYKIHIPRTKLSIDPHIGMFVSVDMTGMVKAETNWGNSELDIRDGESFGDRMDVGLKFGVGVWYKNKYNMDFTVQRGFLMPEYESDNNYGDSYYMRYEGNSLNLMFRIGYAF